MPASFKLAHRLARLRWWFLSASAASVVACGGDNDDPLALVNSNSSVASIEVSPGDLSGTVGQASQFSAIVRDAQGRTLTQQAVLWTSSDSTITRINANGFGTAIGVGTAQVIATAGGKSASARTTVVAASGGNNSPGTVIDLHLSSASDTSVTVTFTEVGDGAGRPATYQLRHAAAPISWSVAATVGRGTCGSPVTGTVIGARRTCVVNGLSAATAYDFQLRAFRALTGQDTVFGGLSNVGKGVTAGGVLVAVAAIIVGPQVATTNVGQASQYTATLRDSSGNVISGRSVTWSSSNAAVVTIDASGLARAVSSGTASISAAAEGKTGTAAVTVVSAAPPATGWPNEPAGLTMLTNQPFDALTSLSWNVTSNPLGLMSVANDPTAPMSASSVLQFRYPAGYTGGEAPGIAYYSHPAYKEVYAGFYWKPSNPWQGHPSNVNKIAFWQAETWGYNLYLQMYGQGPYYLDAASALPGTFHLVANINRTPVALGAWHRIEWHMKYATTAGSADGIIEWWMDGVLQGRYTNIQTPNDRGFIEYQASPTWGGRDGVKNTTDYYLVDHVRISRR